MNRTVLLLVSLAASTLCAPGQGIDPLAPSAVNPKPVPRQDAPAVIMGQPKSPRLPGGDQAMNPDNPTLTIKGIIFVKSLAEVQTAGVSGPAGVVVRDIPVLGRPDFKEMIQKQFLGKLVTDNLIRDLTDAIILYCRARGKLLVDAFLPVQSIESGVLQLVVLEGKIGQVTVKNDGRKWFKDKFILDNVHLRPGESLDSNRLNRDLNWLNNNPFRQVDVSFKPATNLGATDVQLQVEDRIPVRPYVGYENSGTRFTGEDRLLAGVNWGNAFWLDHQLNYQYSTDTDFNLVRAHSASYVAPLPWRHTLTLYGSYVDAKARFTGTGTSAQGTSWQTSARYAIPLPEISKYRHEISAGFDFKRSNNNLEAGGTTVLQASDTDIAQVEAGYSGALADPWGRTSAGLEFYYSPGGLTANNHNSNFELLRTGSRADYFYARLNAERVTRLPADFSWVINAWAQYANERLLPSEELALGGYSTIRGYDERVLLGDNAWIISNELRSPALLLGNLLDSPGGRDEIQVLAFLDYGGVRLDNVVAADGNNPNKTLCSTGLGFRYTVSKNLSFRFDYGFPLTERALNQYRSRAHIGLLLSL
jgi:hemolysin activation/secretion protein